MRWLPHPDDPSIVSIEWEDPERPNGVLTQFIVKLLSYPSNTLIQTLNVHNTNVHEVTFNNAELGESSVSGTAPVLPFLHALTMPPPPPPVAGVPFNFAVIAVNSAGVGEEMVFTNFTKVLCKM